MKSNPVYDRESTVSNRSVRTLMMLLAFDAVLAAAALISFYSMSETISYTGEIQFSAMLNLYVLVASAEFVMIVLMVPALTAGAVSGERERQTLELLLSTQLKPAEIIIGKVKAAFWTINLLIISSFPILSLVFVYGGLLLTDLILLFLYFYITIFFFGSISILLSSLFQRTTVATVLSYLAEVALMGGTILAVYFADKLSQANAHGLLYEDTFRGAGGWIYLLIINPLVNFYGFLNQQAGDRTAIRQVISAFGRLPTNFVTSHWVWIGMAFQAVASVGCLTLASWVIDPLKGGKRLDK